jgi:hypothetical protein
LESKHREKPSQVNEGETKHSPRRKRNGGMPLGHWGRIALKREQYSMYSCCYATIAGSNS